MLYDNANVLSRRSSNTNVVEKIYLIGQEVKSNTYWYFEAIKKGVDLAFHAQVIVEDIAVKVTKLRDISL